MKILVSIALVIAVAAGVVFGGAAHGLATTSVAGLPETTGESGALVTDDDLRVAIGGSDWIEGACAFFAGAVIGGGIMAKIVKRGLLAACGVWCALGLGTVAGFCFLYMM